MMEKTDYRSDPLDALLVAARRYQESEEVIPLDDLPSLTEAERKALFFEPPEDLFSSRRPWSA